MKELRKLRILASIFAALLLCLIGVLVYRHVQQIHTNQSLEANRYSLCEFDDVRVVSIHTEESDIEFSYNEAHQFIGACHDGVEFSPEFLQEDLVTGTVQMLRDFSVLKEFEGDADLSQYGLTDNCSKISISTSDGSIHLLRVGNLLPDKSGIYVQVEGEKRVLIADYSFYQVLYRSFNTYLSSRVIYLERKEVSHIDFSRTTTGEFWSMKPLEDFDNGLYLEHRYLVTEPIEREPSEAMIQLFEQVIQLQAAEFLPINQEDYASYGLEQPEFHFSITKTNGEVTDLFLSMEISGYYYGYCTDIPYTFRISTQMLPGIEQPVMELMEAYVRKEFFTDVRMVRVRIKDTEFEMEYDMGNAQSFDSESVMLLLDSRDAKVFSSSGYCYGLVLFDSIFWMPIAEVDDDASPVLADEEASITVTRTNSEVYTIKLVSKNENQYYCFIDDRYTGYIVDRSVLYKDNGSNLEDFGIWDAYLLANEAIDHQDSDKIYDRP